MHHRFGFPLIAAVVLHACFFQPAFAQQSVVKLSGGEATAVRLTVDDFLRHHYAKSGDLSHYTVRVERSRKQLEVMFVPDTDSRGPYPGGGTDYGPEITHYVSLRPPKILKHLFGQ